MPSRVLHFPPIALELIDVRPHGAGETLGEPLLEVRIRVECRDRCDLVGVLGELGLATDQYGWRSIGILEPNELHYPMIYEGREAHDWIFVVRVSKRKLEIINRNRATDGSIMLKAKLQFTARSENGYQRSYFEYIDRRIASSDWTDILAKTGVCDTLLLELRLPRKSPEQDEKLVRAIEFLQAGRMALASCKFVDAVAQARKALDSIRDWRDDADAVKQFGNQIKDAPKLTALSLEGRIQLIRFATEFLAGPAAHGGTLEAGIQWTDATAKSALAMVAAVLNCYVGAED